MPERWQGSCIAQRTLLSARIVPGGWQTQLSIYLQAWWGHCCIPIRCPFWWRLTTLWACQLGWRWVVVNRCSWQCGSLDIGSLAWSYWPTFFWYEEEWWHLWRFGWDDLSRFEVFINKCSTSLLFLWIKWVDFGHSWGEFFIKFDGMDKGSG